jgi:hypothetical protein
MSDFLTNLVVRSFSRAASVQPVSATSVYLGPEMVTPIDEEVAATKSVSESVSESVAENKHEFAPTVTPMETPAIEPAPRPSLQTRSIADPTSTARTPEPVPDERPPAKPSSAEFNENAPAEGILQRRVANKAIADTPVADTPVAKDKAVAKAKVVAKPKVVGDNALAKDKAVADNAVADNAVADKAENDVRPIVPIAPLNPQPSIRRLTRRPVNAVSLSPRTTSSHFKQVESPTTQTQLRTTQKENPEVAAPEVIERIVEQTHRQTHPHTQTQKETRAQSPPSFEQEQQITASFTTLIPKTSTQPLLPVNIKPRAKVHQPDTPEETPVSAPPSTETVVNVAIGRIDVRASQTASPKRERQTAGPRVMTLDDYVQQRSRGAK